MSENSGASDDSEHDQLQHLIMKECDSVYSMGRPYPALGHLQPGSTGTITVAAGQYAIQLGFKKNLIEF